LPSKDPKIVWYRAGLLVEHLRFFPEFQSLEVPSEVPSGETRELPEGVRKTHKMSNRKFKNISQ
jgi:hypothetical protein